MEFPELGKHCGNASCKQLDFLPMRCDACSKIFCSDHIHYGTHSCAESYKKDNQVPVCPLCDAPIPLKKGELPDVMVGQHIDRDCQSDPAKERRKIYTNKCSYKSCKHKELIPVKCEKCCKNFCLKHRHELDHDCKGFESSGRAGTSAGAAAVDRHLKNTSQKKTQPSTSSNQRISNRPQQNTITNYLGQDLNRERRERQQQRQTTPAQNIQAGLSEDEALARAIQLSMSETGANRPSQPVNKPLTQQEKDDQALAQALAASEQQAARDAQRRQQREEKSTCDVS